MGSEYLKIRQIPGDSRAVICAPHGRDFWTAEIVEMVCQLTGLCGITAHHLEDPSDDLRVNVNRPTEGAGLNPDREIPTLDAGRAYARYLEAIVDVTRGRLGLYVEVHGNETQSHVEVAVAGIGHEVHLIKEALREIPGGALVEGIDEIVKSGAAAKECGTLRIMPRSVQFELPVAARVGHRERALAAGCIAGAVEAVLLSPGVTGLSRLFRA